MLLVGVLLTPEVKANVTRLSASRILGLDHHVLVTFRTNSHKSWRAAQFSILLHLDVVLAPFLQHGDAEESSLQRFGLRLFFKVSNTLRFSSWLRLGLGLLVLVGSTSAGCPTVLLEVSDLVAIVANSGLFGSTTGPFALVVGLSRSFARLAFRRTFLAISFAFLAFALLTSFWERAHVHWVTTRSWMRTRCISKLQSVSKSRFQEHHQLRPDISVVAVATAIQL